MRILRGLTIRQKLISIGMLSSLTALVSASVAFLVYDAYTYRQRMARRILTEAQIISFNSITPLLFNDPEAATATLGGLRAEPAVVAALVLPPEGSQPFATYTRDQGSAAAPFSLPAGLTGGHLFRSDQLLVVEPIRFEGKPIGSLLIRADLSELQIRRRLIPPVVAAVGVLGRHHRCALLAPPARTAYHAPSVRSRSLSRVTHHTMAFDYIPSAVG